MTPRVVQDPEGEREGTRSKLEYSLQLFRCDRILSLWIEFQSLAPVERRFSPGQETRHGEEHAAVCVVPAASSRYTLNCGHRRNN